MYPVALAALLLTSPLAPLASAQDEIGAPPPQSATPPSNAASPPQNINATGNPTAAAQLPSTFTGDPNAPTYPAGNAKPAWRGGTNGGATPPSTGAIDDQARRLDEERRRRAAEPQNNAHTSAPMTQIVSPDGGEPNPGALQGGPQP